MMRSLILSLLLLFAVPVVAQVPDSGPLQFQSEAEETRFHNLAAELRCVMCQNQSLADSNAQIAIELRKEVLNLMRQGKNDAEVKAFLVQRYGEFVLYKPPYSARNAILWAAPVGLLILALGGLIFWQRRHRPAKVTPSSDLPNQESQAQQKDVDW